MQQWPQSRGPKTIKDLDSQSDIPTTATNSPLVDVRDGTRWVDFFPEITGNTTPLSTVLSGYAESRSYSGGPWHRIPVEEFTAGSGVATQYQYNWTRTLDGTATENVVPITVPCIGIEMRLVYLADGADSGSQIDLHVVKRYN